MPVGRPVSLLVHKLFAFFRGVALDFRNQKSEAFPVMTNFSCSPIFFARLFNQRHWGRAVSPIAVLVGLVGALLVAVAPMVGQDRSKSGEWPTYAADLAGTRYRPLDQINASNFNKLEVAWRLKTDSLGNRPEYKLEGTPLMVNRVLYTTAGSRRAVIAVDPATGELL